MIARVATSALALLTLATPAFPCQVGPAAPETWVRDAEIIIRARTVGGFPTAPRVVVMNVNGQKHTEEYPQSAVRLEVLEVLKGKLDERTLEFDGWLTDHDGPSPGPVPYLASRQPSVGHPCGASDLYKKDGEYLLMLRTRNGALTPYWAAMGATSEQLFGPEDRWLAWVRQQLRSAK